MCAGAVLDETGLLPHANPGILDDDELLALREVCAVAGDHARDGVGAAVAARRAALRLARQAARPCASTRSSGPGACAIPYTSGILIGIGETRRERVEALLALRDAARASTGTCRR